MSLELNIISKPEQLKIGEEYTREQLDFLGNKSRNNITIGSNILLGETSQRTGRRCLSISFNKGISNAWFIHTGYDEKSKKKYKLIYFV